MTFVIAPLYHGSGSLFEEFDQTKSRIPNDLWGGGVAYLSDSEEVALQYAKAMSKTTKTHEKFIYVVKTKVEKIFDVDDIFSGKTLRKIISASALTEEQFARNAKLLSYGTDKLDIIAKLKTGDIYLTGAQVFHGISGGMINTSRGRNILKKLGYDTLRYNGMGSTKYSAYLPYYSSRLKILDIKIQN